jgi:hypothetical protein|tara:strand:- start:394 stop:1050 length:657 start_codon:yes stop_codon:yes gene_type:complete
MKSSYFKDNSGEQNLVEDLSVESIKINGRDMIYIPRQLLDEDKLFGEDNSAKFSKGYEFEMYIQSVNGFEGDGDILSKFGISINDRMELVVARKRFEQEVTTYEPSIVRPREGDIIYFPLSRTLFEINFVEHENPFYQLGKLYTYLLICETFTYGHEDLDTGFSTVDKFETDVQGLSGDTIIPLTATGQTAGDNEDLQNFGADIFDFTDTDPFSEGKY